jgi:hypothetical protein
MQTEKDHLTTQRSEKNYILELNIRILTSHRSGECAFEKCMVQSCITWGPVLQFPVYLIYQGFIKAVLE